MPGPQSCSGSVARSPLCAGLLVKDATRVRRHGVLLVVLVACLGACDDDDLVTDASVEVMPARPADAVIDLPADDLPADVAIGVDVRDVPAEVENAPDLRGDCPYPACDEVWFVVPGFFDRFGIEAYDVEVTACRADFCAAARVVTHSNSRINVINRDAAVDAGRVSVPGYASAALRVQLLPRGAALRWLRADHRRDRRRRRRPPHRRALSTRP